MSCSNLIVSTKFLVGRFFLLRLFILLGFTGSFANAEIICTIKADKYSGFKEGLVFNGSVPLAKNKSGAKENRIKVFSNQDYGFYVVPGRSLKTIDETVLLDFYTEIHQTKSEVFFRSRSGETQGFQVAQSELVKPAKNKPKSSGILTFGCKLYAD